MKKLYTTFFIAALSFAAFAQVSINQDGLVAKPAPAASKNSLAPSPMVIDTLWPPSFGGSLMCDTALVYYWLSAPNQGYLTGNNMIQGVVSSTEVGQRYAFSGNGAISEVLVWYAYINGTAGATSVSVYSVAANKNPGTSLGTSNTIALSALTTTAVASYTFSPAVSVTSDFYVNAVLPSNGDTVAIASTVISCNSPDSIAGMNLTLVGWYTYMELLDAAAPLDTTLEVFVVPVVDNTTGAGEIATNNGLTLKGAFPSPATEVTHIMYTLSEASEVSVTVFDLTGKTIYASSGNRNAGNHEVKLSLKDIPAGNYYYTIKTNSAKLTSKFSVVR
ncbi:MAG: T9SS type A sorting domain-containing protein [Bacteroidota bacterium]